MWSLPDSWKWVPIGDIAEVVGGGTPSTTDPANFGGDVPWITPADMSRHVGKQIAGGTRFISEKGLADSGARWLPKGAVLFSSRAPIGYVAVAAKPVTTNQGFKSFVPVLGLGSDFMYYWLTSAKPIAEKLASGTTFLEISGAKAALIPFPLAPAAEQTRIADKLEELLSDLDAGVAELKAAQRKLAQYRQSLLKAAMEGRLTQAWREQLGEPEESGAQLLDRILRERRERWEAKQLAKFEAQGKAPPKGWRDRYPVPAALEPAGLAELPPGWVWASLDMLAEVQGGVQKQPSRAPVQNRYPFLRVANVARGLLKLDEVHEIELFDGELERLALERGDILIVEGNGSLTEIGRCARWDGSIENAVHQNHLIRARPIVMFSEFLEAWLNSLGGVEILMKLAATTSGLYTLSVSKLCKVPVPLPPLNEQASAVGALTDALAAQLLMASYIQKALRQATAQRKNILQAAFSGQLVPQDPNDEPASRLLERIRAERAASGATKARRGRHAANMS
nr:restriction endonuclease subunit S [Variovorax sp. dw_308]